MPMRKPLDLKGTSMILNKPAGTTSDKSRIRGILAAFALLIALMALPLAACSSTSSDPASWKTLGEALDNATDDLSYGYNNDYFVCVFNSGDSVVRVVAKMDPDVLEQIYNLDFSDKNYDSKLEKAIGGLTLVSAEDVTAEKLSPEDLQALIGKTGQELADEGFVFESYFWYGGEQTGATLSKGCFSYNITFDTSITEEQAEDEGASLLNAKVTEFDEIVNTANSAIEPSLVE